MKDARDIVKRPIITEKSYDLMNEGKFTFEVDKKANKIEVKQACEALFNVKAIVTLAEGQTIEKFEV